jgi:hypothetical protein
MQINVPYKELGTVPIELVNIAASLCNEINWADDRYTRDNDISLSTYSRLLPIPSLSDSSFPYTEKEQQLVNACKDIIAKLPDSFSSMKIVNAEIATLPPKTLIKLHYDGKWSHKQSNRIHIPITSNDDSFNIWLNTTCKMNPGMVYEINNRILHGAFNKGDTNRTHLIIDSIDPVIFNNEVSEGRSPWRKDTEGLTPST